MTHNLQFYIDGSWVAPAGGATLDVVNPATEEAYARIAMGERADVDKAVAAARRAFASYSRTSRKERVELLSSVIAVYKKRYDEMAAAISDEMGAPLGFARDSQAAAGLGHLSQVLEVLKTFEFDEVINRTLVTREPVGVCAFITPWNWPMNQITCKVGPALATGCTMVLKPSEVAPMSGLLFTEIMHEAGVPAGVYNMVNGDGPSVGATLSSHPDIDMVSFTGSTSVGRRCVEAAGGNFKKLGLELGGKNPQIVFADADLEDAADGVAFGIGFNTGQCCVSGSRLIVERSVAAEFEKLVAAKLAKVKVGDPLDPTTQIGAITTTAQNTTILSYIAKGKEEGARLVCGGGALDFGRGQYIAPTLFGDVTGSMAIARDEIFGPVLAVMPFDSEDEAIAMANDTVYGLAASVWTKNIDKALNVTRRVRAGRFWVNTTLAGGPELPLGGFKQSGWGREAGSYGIEEYTQIKSVHIEIGKREPWVR